MALVQERGDQTHVGGGCASSAEGLLNDRAVSVTYWVNPDTAEQPYTASVSFRGHLIGGKGASLRGQRFQRVEAFRAVPGSGPVAVTAKVNGLDDGVWEVQAQLLGKRSRSPTHATAEQPPRGSGLWRLPWSRTNTIDQTPIRVHTRLAARSSAPGIVLGAWPVFVGAGWLLALLSMALLLTRAGVGVAIPVGVGVLASVVGAVGARVWYLVLQRGDVNGLPTRGLCIQGFLTGFAVVFVLGLLVARVPVGVVLDALSPGLFLAMALGRQGCLLTGCCEGPITGSRWGVWSSDGRIGARRIPTQLLEALLCLLIAALALLSLLLWMPATGVVFIAAVAVYTVGRQGLLTLRAVPRKTSWGRQATVAVAVAALVGLVVSALVG